MHLFLRYGLLLQSDEDDDDDEEEEGEDWDELDRKAAKADAERDYSDDDRPRKGLIPC